MSTGGIVGGVYSVTPAEGEGAGVVLWAYRDSRMPITLPRGNSHRRGLGPRYARDVRKETAARGVTHMDPCPRPSTQVV